MPYTYAGFAMLMFNECDDILSNLIFRRMQKRQHFFMQILTDSVCFGLMYYFGTTLINSTLSKHGTERIFKTLNESFRNL